MENNKEIQDSCQSLQMVVSSSADEIINYIETDAEIAMPINELMNEDGTHLTKKEYGKVLLKYLVIKLRERYC